MSSVKQWIPSAVTVIRAVSLGVFLFTTFSISVSWYSLSSLIVLLVSIYGVSRTETGRRPHPKFVANPLKGKPGTVLLSDSREQAVNALVGKFVSNYDPENCVSLETFEPVKQGSECIFARKARLWGAQDWNSELSLEENVYRSVPSLLKFTLVCQELGLDGFLFLLPGQVYAADVQVFGQSVRRVLKTVSDLDPSGFRVMDKFYIDKPGWVFEFNRVTFFVTTFAPFYRPSSSRYAHEATDAFVLLQPEISFAQHDLPADVGVAGSGERRATVRDRIRDAFREAGRGYPVRNARTFPMVREIVKPEEEGEEEEVGEEGVVRWWVKDDDSLLPMPR